MERSFALTQKVNFYISATFILLFGLLLTTTVVNAINRDASDLKYLTASADLGQ
jgi:hypothetical protein